MARANSRTTQNSTAAAHARSDVAVSYVSSATTKKSAFSPGMRVALTSALRSSSSFSAGAHRAAATSRALSVPLCFGVRYASGDARADAPTVSTARCIAAEEEEVHTSFGGESAGSASTPAAAAHRARGGAFSRTSHRPQRQPPQQQPQRRASSAQLLHHSRGYQKSGRYGDGDGGFVNNDSPPGVVQESRAVLSARLMRRHRLHATQPYLVVSSGVEVPGCSGGAYHLQERQNARGASIGAMRASAYANRVRSGGNNVRMSAFPASLTSSAAEKGGRSSATTSMLMTAAAQTSPQVLYRDAVYARMQSYEPFERLFRRYVERGHVVNVTQRLLHHPDAPAPIVLLDRILQHRVPAPTLVSQALLSTMHAARTDRSSAGAAAFALQRVVSRLRTDAMCRLLYDIPNIRALLLEATLRDGLFDVAMEVVHDTPAAWITPHAWSLLVQAAGQSKLPHSQLLWRLLSIHEGAAADGGGDGSTRRVLTRAGESALLKRVPLRPPYSPVSVNDAPPAPCASASSSAPATASTTPEHSNTSAASTASLSNAVNCTCSRSTDLSSELPLAASHVPDSVFEARACSTVLMPTFSSIGTPLFRSSDTAVSTTAATPGALVKADGGEDDASFPTAATTASYGPSSSALVSSAFNTEGMRWCALGSVDMGYAAEHYSGDTAAAAGDFRAAGTTGVLHGFHSFNSLFSEVEAEVQQALASSRANSSTAASSSSRVARRALWETTALRMVHHHHGIAYGLDATTTARVLLRCGVGFSGQASPLLALNVLRRYLRSCHLLRDEIVRAQELIEAQLDAEEGVLRWEDDDDDGSPSKTSSSPSVDNTHAADAPVEKSAEEATATTTTTAVVIATNATRRSAAELLKLYPRLSRAVAPHPSPFLVFFKVMREAREVLSNAVEEEATAAAAAAAGSATANAGRARTGLRTNSSLPMVHWELVWHTFQQLNRENPRWFTEMTLQEAGDLCQDVIEVLCHGADPWLTLNISRRVSIRHIVDGVDMSLWLLHRLDPSHHTEEAREVARRLFRWLLVDVGIHLQPALHHHLIPAARALIRLNLQEELRVLYSAVLDNVYLFRPEHRDAFIAVLQDLICPSCASILPESDVYVDRACPNCMTVVPAKDADTIPSFHLSAEHVERLRARRKQQRQRSRQRLTASVHRLQSTEHSEEVCSNNGEGSAVGRFGQRQLRGPRDAAEVLRRHLQKTKDEEGDGLNGGSGDSTDGVMALLLSDAATLVPGVPVMSDVALFPVPGGASVLDVRAAMEESSRRLELQRAARQYALMQQGVSDSDAAVSHGSSSGPVAVASRTPAAMPTTLPISAQALDAATLKYLSTATTTTVNAAAASAAQDGAWVCVWCQEKNDEWSSRVRCGACGAETGPSAPWRHFAYTDPVKGDVMAELRGRMSNCVERPIDAIVAGYMLMVYRRTFQLRATPADQERLQRLIVMLCRLQERVLAAYVYTRLVPLTQRRVDALLDLLAQTFGQENEERYRALTQEDVTRPDRENTFFDAVFGPQTCRVCFGNHDWHVCPIVTRDFAGSGSGADAAHQQQRSPISLSPEEKQQAVLERLAQRIHSAVKSAVAPATTATPETSVSASPATTTTAKPGRPNAQLVVDAYVAFVSSPFREIFAELHAEDTNTLSLLLSRIQQYRRAAFVLCHIPLAKRSTEAYLKLVPFFNVTEEEALALLEKKPAQPSSSSSSPPAPNFVQVTKTCCMCLDQRHASHECPRLEEWLKGVQRLAKGGEAARAAAAAKASAATRITTALVDSAGEVRLRQRLRAQVDGWTTAGPERLHAFYRYLETHLDLLRPTSTAPAESIVPRRIDFNDPLVYAVNKTVTKLATLDRRAEAYRLYAHAPIECVSTATTSAMLRMNGFAEDSIQALLKSGDESELLAAEEAERAEEADLTMARSSSSVAALSRPGQHAPAAARAAAVPMQRCCLLCFSASHAFVECPELAAAATEAEKLLLIAKEVGGITCVHDGIAAAAAYVYSEYNRGRLSSEMMRSNPALVTALLTLARRCFATHQLSHGMRVLRRVPVEMVPPATVYADLWRAAGLPEAEVERKQVQLSALFDTEGLIPCIDPPPPRPTYSNSFLSQLSRTLHDGLCRHCYEQGHTIATCPLFHAEVSFGRDYVAAYRMSMMSEQLDRPWQEAYLLKLVDFFSTHYLFMPYHIAGVANALNAITAMWSFRGEPGIALRNLLLIPPAYRRRQAFKHVLHSLRVPSADITRLLGDFYFAPDNVGGAAGTGGSPQQQQEVMMAQHLLIPKPAIRDLARRQIFEQVPSAMAALEESTERMAQIRESHERRGTATAGKVPGGGGIGAHLQQSSQRQQQGSHERRTSPPTDGVAAASFNSPILRRVMQSGGMAQLREDFDPILAELEDAVGMRLGSRHILFTSAMDIVGSAAAVASVSAPSVSAGATAGSGDASRMAEARVNNAPSSVARAAHSSFEKAATTAGHGAAHRGTPEAEAVINVQTKTVKSAASASASPPPQQQQQQHPTAERTPPPSSAPHHRRGRQQQSRRQMHNNNNNIGTQSTRHSPSSAAAESSALAASPSAAYGAGSRASEDEVRSSFPASSTHPSPQQRSQRSAGSGGNNSHRRASHINSSKNDDSNSRDYRGSRGGSQRNYGNSRQQHTTPPQSWNRGKNAKGDAPEKL